MSCGPSQAGAALRRERGAPHRTQRPRGTSGDLPVVDAEPLPHTVIPECAWPYCRLPACLSGFCAPHASALESEVDPFGEDFPWS
jgi:hypothetical protein